MRIGVDAQPVAEVRQSLSDHGDHYRRRLFTEHELAACASVDREAEGLAARFAAKEAALKVLRVGSRMPAWTDIEVVREPGGWPRLALHGVAAQLAGEAGLTAFDVSLTHTDELAIAVIAAA